MNNNIRFEKINNKLIFKRRENQILIKYYLRISNKNKYKSKLINLKY